MVVVFTYKSNSGRESVKPYQRRNGGRRSVMDRFSLSCMSHSPPEPEVILCEIRCNCSADCISLKCVPTESTTSNVQPLVVSVEANSLQRDDSKSSSEDDGDS